MEEDISKELELKNQEMLLNKKKIDLDKAMESLFVSFITRTPIIASEMNENICLYKNIDSNSEQGKILYNTITSFFFIASKKIEEIVTSDINPIKDKLKNLSDDEYNKELTNVSVAIINKIKDYFIENLDMLKNELNQDVSEDVKNKINDYLYRVINIKVINMIREKLMYAVIVVNNNNEENNQIMENLNEKIIKKV